MFHEKRVLAIIPARGGSKRVPRKNIRLLSGRPLLAYTVDVAMQTPAIDRTIVSTDDEEIRDVARRCGADVPFLRPAELAGDRVPDGPVLVHALQFLEERGERFDYVFNLRPTTPFKESGDIEGALAVAEANRCDLVRSVTRAEGTGHPYWMYVGEHGLLKPLFPEKSIREYYRSQLLPKNIFALAGVVDLFTVAQLRDAPWLYESPRMGYVAIPKERAMDIDGEDDFLVAETLMNRYHAS